MGKICGYLCVSAHGGPGGTEPLTEIWLNCRASIWEHTCWLMPAMFNNDLPYRACTQTEGTGGEINQAQKLVTVDAKRKKKSVIRNWENTWHSRSWTFEFANFISSVAAIQTSFLLYILFFTFCGDFIVWNLAHPSQKAPIWSFYQSASSERKEATREI